MSSFFSTDGLLYKVSIVIYRLLLLNFLWFLFSIPILTIGASTTALFYITGKIMRGKVPSSILMEFWGSFKLNLKQATIIFMILLLAFIIIFANITNIKFFGSFAIIIYPLNLFVLLHLFILFIFSFPILARYHLKIKDCFKLALYFAYQNKIISLLCLTVIPGIYILLTWNGGFYLLAMGIYSCWINYFIQDKVDNLLNLDER